VIEAQVDKTRGVIATLLVQNGTLRTGDTLIAGDSYGKIRAMFNFVGKPVKSAAPSTPVQVLGLSTVPPAGELFRVVANEKVGRAILAEREAEKPAALSHPPGQPSSSYLRNSRPAKFASYPSS